MLEQENYTLRMENMALRKKLAYLSERFYYYMQQMKQFIHIDPYDEVTVKTTYEQLKHLIKEKKQITPDKMKKIAVSIFLRLVYQYTQELGESITYKEFLSWLQTRHPNIYNAYSQETITRVIRALRQEGYLYTPRNKRGVFYISIKGFEKLASMREK